MGNPGKDRYFKKHEADNRDGNKAVNDLFPKFSFEFNVGNDRGVAKGNKPVRVAVIDKVIRLSSLSWKEIKALPREQGFEKIEVGSFGPLPGGIPNKFKDIDKIDVFRLPSKKGRLIGFIEDETFYVVWVDTEFNMYKH